MTRNRTETKQDVVELNLQGGIAQLPAGELRFAAGVGYRRNTFAFTPDPADVFNLIQRYPHRVKDLWGDLGVCPFEFEIWKSICLLTYPDLCEHALDEGDFLVVSLEKLLLLKALAMRIEKYRLDAEMIVNHLLEKQYRSYDQVQAENAAFIAQVPGIVYIEKTGPEQ